MATDIFPWIWKPGQLYRTCMHILVFRLIIGTDLAWQNTQLVCTKFLSPGCALVFNPCNHMTFMHRLQNALFQIYIWLYARIANLPKHSETMFYCVCWFNFSLQWRTEFKQGFLYYNSQEVCIIYLSYVSISRSNLHARTSPLSLFRIPYT